MGVGSPVRAVVVGGGWVAGGFRTLGRAWSVRNLKRED